MHRPDRTGRARRRRAWPDSSAGSRQPGALSQHLDRSHGRQQGCKVKISIRWTSVIAAALCLTFVAADKPATTKKTATKTASTKKAADVPKEKPPEGSQRWAQMQYGSLLSATFENRQGSKEFTHKGIAITCSVNPQARVIFDTELLRYTAGW